MTFIDERTFFKFEIEYILIKPSELKNFNSVESYDEKTVENCRNSYIAKNCIVSKLLKILVPNFNNTNLKIEARLCQNFTYLSLILSEK